MYAQVEKYLTVPHEFYCFTDSAFEIDSKIHCKNIYKLWGSRKVDDVPHGGLANLSIFGKNFPFSGRILYLDLDVILLKNIDELVSYAEYYADGLPNTFTAIWDWCSQDWNGSVNIFEAGFCSELWEYATPIENGQKWLLKMVPHGRAWPTEWCKSYKAHYLTGQMTNECKILVYHGDPKPHTLEPWGGLA